MADEFVERLMNVIESTGLNQKEFASKAKISSPFLSQIKTNNVKPGFDFLYNILKELNVNVNWLLSGKGEMFLNGEEDKRDIFSRVPLNDDIIDMVRHLEVPIIKNALLVRFLEVQKEYENYIKEHFDRRAAQNEK